MLHPCTTQPTRIIEHQRPSIIDNIFINANKKPIHGNIINRISDHFPNFILIKDKKSTIEVKTVHYKRNMKNYNPVRKPKQLNSSFPFLIKNRKTQYFSHG